mmetsp:Transcript_36093/g.94499  ORF Transcript_36093/g.94499 Transcript_36093/m.94499 type:complete len:747 (-) Transcript_36093:14-2254(-)
MIKKYIVQKLIQDYLENGEEVLNTLSFLDLLKGQCKLRKLVLRPNFLQDVLHAFLPFGLEIRKVTVEAAELKVPWQAITSSSTLLQLRNVVIEVTAHDLDQFDTEVKQSSFWSAQCSRAAAAAEAAAEAAKAATQPLRPFVYGLLSKVADGVQVHVDSITFTLRTAAAEEAATLFVKQLSWAPALASWESTALVKQACTYDKESLELITRKQLRIGSACLSKQGCVALSLDSFRLNLLSKSPAYQGEETDSKVKVCPFSATSVVGIELDAISCEVGETDLLEHCSMVQHVLLADHMRIPANLERLKRSIAGEAPPAVGPRERFKTLARTATDLEEVIRNFKRASQAMGADDPQKAALAALGESVTVPGPGTDDNFVSPAPSESDIVTDAGWEGADGDDDNDQFLDADDRALQLQAMASRVVFKLREARVELACLEGTVALRLWHLHGSLDSVSAPTPRQLTCLSEVHPDVDGAAPLGLQLPSGTAHAGVGMDSLRLSFSGREVVNVGPTSVRFRGPADPYHVFSVTTSPLDVAVAALSVTQENEFLAAVGPVRARLEDQLDSPELPPGFVKHSPIESQAPSTPRQSQTQIVLRIVLENVTVLTQKLSDALHPIELSVPHLSATTSLKNATTWFSSLLFPSLEPWRGDDVPFGTSAEAPPAERQWWQPRASLLSPKIDPSHAHDKSPDHVQRLVEEIIALRKRCMDLEHPQQLRVQQRRRTRATVVGVVALCALSAFLARRLMRSHA